ncbi:MAG TPA: ABC transporter permease, partial [Longimicrobiales bacterium]|nr:ABC transporter permease [Longimicrobiales bacterium]
MDLPGRPDRRRRRLTTRWLTWLLRDEAEWVLGDLEERRRKRKGNGRRLALVRDLLSVTWWALLRRRAGSRWKGTHRRLIDVRAGALADVFSQDVRHALSTLRRDRGFSVITTLTLAVGIGVNTAVFSVVRAVLLAPLPYEDADRLVMVWTEITDAGVREGTSAYANIRDWKTQNRVFEDLATFDPTTLTLTDGDWPEQMSAVAASANLFSVLGVTPVLGRTFSLDEERGRARVAVLSHELWQRRFGGSPAAIGRTLEVNGTPIEVIGVMPDGYAFPNARTQAWLPQTFFADWEARAARRGTDSWRVVGRLRPGVSVQRALGDMREIADRLEQDHPSVNSGLGINLVPLYDQVTGHSVRLALWTLFGAVGLVLAIACANAAHLILARGLKRSREYSLRVALGATTPRLVRLALAESLVLSLAAGLTGLGLAIGGLRVLVALAPANLPRLDEIGIDTTVLIYAFGISVAVGVAFGMAPAFGHARSGVYDRSGQGRGSAGARGHRGRSVLIVTQFALAIVLVFGTNLLIRSFVAVRGVEPGFEAAYVLMANLSAA